MTLVKTLGLVMVDTELDEFDDVPYVIVADIILDSRGKAVAYEITFDLLCADSVEELKYNAAVLLKEVLSRKPILASEIEANAETCMDPDYLALYEIEFANDDDDEEM